jgi:signal transduction histidine kinase
MPVIRRVAIGSAVSITLVAMALAATILSYRGAVAESRVALTDVKQNKTAERAETYLWREREAMNEYLLTHDPLILDEIRTLRTGLHETLSSLGQDEADAALVGIVLAANESFLAAFRSNLVFADRSESQAELIRVLNGGEELALAPLHTLEAVNVAEVRRSQARADAGSRRALTEGALAGALALMAGLVFAWYAIMLVRRIARRNDALRQLDRMKDDFVSTVSHELRTPLTSINGYLEVLLDGDAGTLSEEQAGFLGVIRKNSDRLLRLVGDLRFVGNVSVDVTIERVPVELASLVRRALQDAQQPFVDRDIALTYSSAGLIELDGDPSRLAQLVENLLSNALKFTPPGGRVEVCLTSLDGAARLQVSDTGMGISEADQKLVFERFYRSADANDRAIQGPGLGLAIVAAIVEAHGGSIEIESELGVGTTFTVVLPMPAELSVAA